MRSRNCAATSEPESPNGFRLAILSASRAWQGESREKIIGPLTAHRTETVTRAGFLPCRARSRCPGLFPLLLRACSLRYFDRKRGRCRGISKRDRFLLAARKRDYRRYRGRFVSVLLDYLISKRALSERDPPISPLTSETDRIALSRWRTSSEFRASFGRRHASGDATRAMPSR